MNQLQGSGHDKGVRQLVAPLDASPKRSLTLTADGPDTPLHSRPIGLKSFDDGQPLFRNRTISLNFILQAREGIFTYIMRGPFFNALLNAIRRIRLSVSPRGF